MKEIQNEEHELLKLLGTRVREYRKSLGISQEQLAELAKVHPIHIHKIENARASASISIYARLASAMRVPLTQLVDIESPANEKDDLEKTFIAVKLLDKEDQRTVVETVRALLICLRRNAVKKRG